MCIFNYKTCVYKHAYICVCTEIVFVQHVSLSLRRCMSSYVCMYVRIYVAMYVCSRIDSWLLPINARVKLSIWVSRHTVSCHTCNLWFKTFHSHCEDIICMMHHDCCFFHRNDMPACLSLTYMHEQQHNYMFTLHKHPHKQEHTYQYNIYTQISA